MQQEEIRASFDDMAPSYDAQWSNLRAINDSLHLLMGGVLSGLKPDAHILCVGAGTGAEIIYLAQKFPEWRFMAVEPSTGMLDVCRNRLSALGLEERCRFHPDYIETLTTSTPFDAATSLLVSQFLMDEDLRIRFFRAIADRLKPGAVLVSSDLSADLNSSAYPHLLHAWLAMMKQEGISAESLDGMKNAYGKSVAVLPQANVAKLIRTAGFEKIIHFYQAGLIHGWYGRKSVETA